MSTHTSRRGARRRPQAAMVNRGAPSGFAPQRMEHDKQGTDAVDPFLAADLAMTKRIGRCLEEHYPSHPWMVVVNHAQGVAQIRLPVLMPKNEYFVLHLNNIYSDPGLRCVMRAGGSILERYGCPRSHFSLDHFLGARSATLMGRRRPPMLVMADGRTPLGATLH